MNGAVIALSLGAAFCFGLALVLTQLGLRGMGAVRGASISVPSTACLFLVAASLSVDFSRWDWAAVTMFVMAGFLFPAPVTMLTFESNRRIGPNLTGALGNLAPLFAVALAVVLLGETPGPGQLLAIVVVLAGVVMLFDVTRSSVSQLAMWTLALPLAAAFLRGVVQPVVKVGLGSWPDPIAAVTIGYAVSAAIVLAARLFVKPPVTATTENGRTWPWFIATGICNGMAVLLLYAALARGPVVIVAPLVACYPLATLALSRLILGGAGISGRMIAGVAVTVAGVALLLILS